MKEFLKDGSFGNMITIKEETIIEAKPESIFNFITRIDTFYKVWHPKDHVFCKAIFKDLNQRGCVFHFLEKIGGFPLYLIVKVSKIKKNEYIEYKPAFLFSFFNLGMGYFSIESVSKNTSKLTAYVEYGNRFGLLDKVSRFFINTDLAKKHIQEEGENIKRYLEDHSR
ncbi:MAG TPA: hypothetical protein DEV73_01905 [Candidatus Zambryskibacteria bacterium]|nr:MAG: hypothetical protein UV90_C0010G0003 [candidate division WWE3 bacterium GW2011_GWA2_43_24]HCH59352.1 hypothetical protein [Candidatus Zambryskibacteria bacterium]